MTSRTAPQNKQSFGEQQEELAALSFIDKFINGGYNYSINLQVCALRDALYSIYYKQNQNKILLLYLHNEESNFSTTFCSLISDKNMKSLLDENFIILGWDVGKEIYHESLIDSLNTVYSLMPFAEKVLLRQSVAIFVHLVDMDFEVCSVMNNIYSFGDMKRSFEILRDNFCLNIDEDVPYTCNNGTEDSKNCGYKEFQKCMFETLGNRDYDRFDGYELERLRQKIAYALFGMPTDDSGYSEKQTEETSKMFDIILTANNEFCEFENQVCLAVVYNCLVPLEHINSKDQYCPVPVFILRKCLEAKEKQPCRIVIDHTRRVYTSWKCYLEDNKFGKCFMVVPEGGRYKGEDIFQLTILESPSCSFGKRILNATDIGSAVVGLGTSGVMAAAAIPAITVAPLVLAGAAVTGAGVGLYCIGRSVYHLIDRGIHRESLNVAESEARAAYINIAAGAVGFAAAGANVAVSQLAANGATIGTTARIGVNTLGISNIGIGGLALGNSTVDIIKRWVVDDEPPTPFTVLQLSTSILFFGHAVYSYQSAGTIIEESQTSAMKSIKDSLRSNRHRKTLNKMTLETIRQNNGNVQKGRAELISTIRKISNKDDVFAYLTRNNKKFNEMGIKFAASEGTVKLNGLPLNMNEVGSISKQNVYGFYQELPQKSTSNAIRGNNKIFNFGDLMSRSNAMIISNILNNLIRSDSLRLKIQSILEGVLTSFGTGVAISKMMTDLFPNGAHVLEYLKMVLSFIQKCVEDLQYNYENRKFNADDAVYKYIGDFSDAERKVLFMQKTCDKMLALFRGSNRDIAEIVTYCGEWVINATMQRDEMNERNDFLQRTSKKYSRVTCTTCRGYYFE